MILEIVGFRLMGVGILLHEVVLVPTAEWRVLVAGFGCFFMPDALAGRHTVALQLLAKLLERFK